MRIELSQDGIYFSLNYTDEEEYSYEDATILRAKALDFFDSLLRYKNEDIKSVEEMDFVESDESKEEVTRSKRNPIKCMAAIEEGTGSYEITAEVPTKKKRGRKIKTDVTPPPALAVVAPPPPPPEPTIIRVYKTFSEFMMLLNKAQKTGRVDHQKIQAILNIFGLESAIEVHARQDLIPEIAQKIIELTGGVI